MATRPDETATKEIKMEDRYGGVVGAFDLTMRRAARARRVRTIVRTGIAAILLVGVFVLAAYMEVALP